MTAAPPPPVGLAAVRLPLLDPAAVVRHGRARHRRTAVVLLLLDALFLAANLAWLGSNDPDEPSTRFSDPHWNGDRDGSFVEVFGHVQLIAAATGLAFLAVRRRSAVLGAWVLVLVAIVADDFLQLHERIGVVLVDRLALPAVLGLRPRDLGEMLVWAGMAAVLGAVLLIAHLLSLPRDRRASLVLLGRVAILAVFAVGVDQLHIVVQPHVPHVVALALTLTETAGELVGMTLVLLAVQSMATASPAARPRAATG